jgi:hypothetical protein
MKQFRKQMNLQLDKMVATGKLFRANLTGDSLWKLYLASFDNDPIFRDPESSVHDCNHCNNFIRRYGNIVALDENLEIITLFGFIPEEEEFIPVTNALDKALKECKIKDVFFETFNSLNSLPYEVCKKTATSFKLGVDTNIKRYTPEEADLYGVVTPKKVYTFEHMSLQLPKDFVKMGKESIEKITSDYRDAKYVFKRGMDEISGDTLSLVEDLIKQGSLLDGTAHLDKVIAFKDLKIVYDKVPEKDKDNWCWINSYQLNIAKFKNTLIGVLCSELSEGMELNKACQNWNKRVDPVNYMKATAPITKKQIAEAKLFVETNGYEESFNRRVAVIEDIKASEILHLNSGDGKIAKLSVFDNVKSTSTRHKKSEFEGVEEIPIEKFMKDILPGCTSVEAFLKNNHENHMVTLTTSADNDSRPIFKWPNNYSWTFNGNLAGKSELAKKVESKGGRIDGVFRFTHSWNELEPNQSLMDLHVFMPGCKLPNQFTGGPTVMGRRVGWNQRSDTHSGGIQDVDYTAQAPKGYIPVENITFPTLSKMPEGVYTCMIHNWNYRGSGGKGKAEIEFNGNLYQYIYPATKNHEWVTIAEVTLKDGEFFIEHKLSTIDGFGESKEFYGLETNHFHKVNLVCLSPNYWGESEIGNKHYFFMLEGAKTPTSVRGFHNENLNSKLLKYRKVMEVLANTTMVEPDTKELSGLGFNSTVRDEVILRLKGSHKRVVKVKF